jgi:DmsE family decaheme c-type cytochrome
MSRRKHGFPVGLLVTLILVASSLSVALHPGAVSAAGGEGQDARTGPKPTGSAQLSAASLASGQANDYVGEETCLGCHETQSYVGTRHALTSIPRSPAATHGCESCHGPGKAHVEEGDPSKIINPAKLTPQRASETCATCHDRGGHALWSGSQHDSRNVGCVTCHSVHSSKGPKQLKAATELAQCASCHKDKIAKLDRSGHMPVREGKMQCSSCHNPHGTTNVKLLRRGDSIAEACTSCHAEKRGPYLWEHAPGRDGCTTCHDPHGSSNERMLVSKPPILCQRCHVGTRHPSTIYDAGLIGAGATPSVRIYARSCVTCHSMIHGSNHPSGQRFIR